MVNGGTNKNGTTHRALEKAADDGETVVGDSLVEGPEAAVGWVQAPLSRPVSARSGRGTSR